MPALSDPVASADNQSCRKTVSSDWEPLQRRVESIVQIAMAIVTPLSALASGHGGTKSLSLVDDIPAIKKRAVGEGDVGGTSKQANPEESAPVETSEA